MIVPLTAVATIAAMGKRRSRSLWWYHMVRDRLYVLGCLLTLTPLALIVAVAVGWLPPAVLPFGLLLTAGYAGLGVAIWWWLRRHRDWPERPER